MVAHDTGDRVSIALSFRSTCLLSSSLGPDINLPQSKQLADLSPEAPYVALDRELSKTYKRWLSKRLANLATRRRSIMVQPLLAEGGDLRANSSTQFVRDRVSTVPNLRSACSLSSSHDPQGKYMCNKKRADDKHKQIE